MRPVTTPPPSPKVDEIQRALAETVERAGPFTNEVYLRDGVWTKDGVHPGGDFRLRWLLQMVADLAPKPISQIRILDLGCEEGLYGLEFARHGAEVVGVDGRQPHVDRARFLAEAVGVSDRFEAVLGDAREIDPGRLGRFDLVLCLGLLYHLDRNDLAPFARRMASLSLWGTVVYSQIALRARESFEADGRRYWGHPYFEHPAQDSAEDKLERTLASLDNPESFWLTRPSLVNLLTDAGYTTVMERVGPHSATTAHTDRVTLLALRGETQEVLFCPGASDYPPPRWDEKSAAPRHEIATTRGWLRDRLRSSRAGSILRRVLR